MKAKIYKIVLEGIPVGHFQNEEDCTKARDEYLPRGEIIEDERV